jgi:hypothetical protein
VHFDDSSRDGRERIIENRQQKTENGNQPNKSPDGARQQLVMIELFLLRLAFFSDS